ncbi:MAG: hypothetical protein M0P13_07640, partial [Fibrobacteraceae bacterium]|nr:hypothetical protein [Fibrobacteraceae bacterium]
MSTKAVATITAAMAMVTAANTMAKRNRDALIAFILLYTNLFAASPVIFTEHNRNLQTLESVPMLFNYHRQTISEERAFFTYPRRDTSFIRNFKQTEENALFSSSQELNGHFYAFAASIVGGVDYRGSETLGDTIRPGIDGGLYFRGFADSLDFDLDARIYAEKHTAEKAQSYDGEVFDTQTEEGNAGADYVSYARYRAHMGLNYSWMRLQLARDVMHWGPGYYNNLALNQFALPYNMLSLEFYFGPLHIETFYADLRVASWSYSLKNLNNRNLYGHRYELALKNLTIGVTELQVLYNENKPWLFTPFV